MTVATYALGRPRPAASRGGDCRAHDLDQARNVHGPHRFASATHCQISNGLLRLTVGASGAAPSLTVEVQRRKIVFGDTYDDLYSDLYDGALDGGTWLAIGTITIDSSLVTALLTAVRIERLTPEAVTIRLVSPAINDVFVKLRRGERMVRIQHGNTRGTQVTTNRRVRWTASPSPAGTTSTGRVEEIAAAVGLDGLHRFIAIRSTATVNASAFSATAAGVASATFAAGVGVAATNDRPLDMHKQLGDVSRQRLVVA